MSYKLHKLQHGKRLSLFVKGFPKFVVLSENTDQKILEHLYNNGDKFVKKENGNNKG